MRSNIHALLYLKLLENSVLFFFNALFVNEFANRTVV